MCNPRSVDCNLWGSGVIVVGAVKCVTGEASSTIDFSESFRRCGLYSCPSDFVLGTDFADLREE